MCVVATDCMYFLFSVCLPLPDTTEIASSEDGPAIPLPRPSKVNFLHNDSHLYSNAVRMKSFLASMYCITSKFNNVQKALHS